MIGCAKRANTERSTARSTLLCKAPSHSRHNHLAHPVPAHRSHTSDMGRGKSWDIDENEVLARAWIAASEDPVVGADQKAKRFSEAMHRRFIEKGPQPPAVPDGKYGNRPVMSCKAHFSDLSADVQKFAVALRKVHASNPTGVNEDNVLSMAVAIHLGKTTMMEYKYKDYLKDNWISFKAWNVLHCHPKWQVNSPSQESDGSVNRLNTSSCDIRSHESTENSAAPSSSHLPSHSRPDERYSTGNKAAKLQRQEELRTQAVRSMADSAKRKSTALEERNAIAVFSLPGASQHPETALFFAALRRTHLAQALKKARLANANDDSLLEGPDVLQGPHMGPGTPVDTPASTAAASEPGQPVNSADADPAEGSVEAPSTA